MGSGPAGLGVAISLAKRNFNVLVGLCRGNPAPVLQSQLQRLSQYCLQILEKQASPTPEAVARPRSYVYGINTRGLWALDQVQLYPALQSLRAPFVVCENEACDGQALVLSVCMACEDFQVLARASLLMSCSLLGLTYASHKSSSSFAVFTHFEPDHDAHM